MNLFDALILGIVQGLTEFLPISSSAHVQIAQSILGLGSIPKPQLTAFIATIQLGTELAVLIYFWRDILNASVFIFFHIIVSYFNNYFLIYLCGVFHINSKYHHKTF